MDWDSDVLCLDLCGIRDDGRSEGYSGLQQPIEYMGSLASCRMCGHTMYLLRPQQLYNVIGRGERPEERRDTAESGATRQQSCEVLRLV